MSDKSLVSIIDEDELMIQQVMIYLANPKL